MAYYVLEVRNDTGTKTVTRESFNTKKAALKAYSKIMNGYGHRQPLGVRSKVVVRILYYPS